MGADWDRFAGGNLFGGWHEASAGMANLGGPSNLGNSDSAPVLHRHCGDIYIAPNAIQTPMSIRTRFLITFLGAWAISWSIVAIFTWLVLHV